MKLMIVYREDEVGRPVVEWNEPMVYEVKDKFGRVEVQVKATPEQILQPEFDIIHSRFDANPLKEKQTFRQEIHKRLNECSFRRLIYNSKGDSHLFRVMLAWRVK